ncbi:MAG: hypothetical protein Q9227_005977 [Pyrenula ochraceoflavens]
MYIVDIRKGVDDVWAILLALAAKPEELEIMLISTTFGNVEVRKWDSTLFALCFKADKTSSCLRNVITLLNVLEKEIKWRQDRGQAAGYEGLKSKPVIAVGAEGPLEEQIVMADYFHGRDGLAGIHSSHPHLSPGDTWKRLFEKPPQDTEVSGTGPVVSVEGHSFRPSLEPAHREILRILKENEADTITIVAIGPMTNLALAASEDTETFLKVKEVVSMGGAVDIEGNCQSGLDDATVAA